MKIKEVRYYWKKLRENWLINFRIIIRNEKKLADIFSLRLSPRRIFVLGTSSMLFLIIITAMLIAFTPLRVYVPGYTKPIEYNMYRKMLIRVDSLERVNTMRKTYLDNYSKVLNDMVEYEKMDAPMDGASEKRITNKEQAEQAKKQISEEADKLQIEVVDRSAKSFISLVQQSTLPSFSFTMPALGVISKRFSILEKHFGIDIENERGTLITAIADGVVVSAQNSEKEENSIIIQHSGNMISIYKNVDKLLKNMGAKVKLGDPIATMGKIGTESQNAYLHFEIWYNGTPINPLNYFVSN